MRKGKAKFCKKIFNVCRRRLVSSLKYPRSGHHLRLANNVTTEDTATTAVTVAPLGTPGTLGILDMVAEGAAAVTETYPPFFDKLHICENNDK